MLKPQSSCPSTAQDHDDADAATATARWSFFQRYGLVVVGLSPLIANAIGSVFNIAYNHEQVEPLLSVAQMARFNECWQWFNLLVYPIAVVCFVTPLVWLRPVHNALIAGDAVDADVLQKAQKRIVNLPWWFLLVAAVGWLSCIPVFPAALYAVREPLSSDVVAHLITSFLTASLIAVTHSFFAVELAIQKFLFPVFFQHGNPAAVPGGVPLNITARGVLWIFSAVVSPVVSLVLILLLPDAAHRAPWFAVAVGLVAILFGLMSSVMLSKLVATPIHELNVASMRVAQGDLTARVDLLRADDFGMLIERFNNMVQGLREREQLQQTFGRHVGEEAARQIMSQGDNLSGREERVSVMFVDVRNFTHFSSHHSPEQVVTALNVFFREAVELVESHGGMVNKFLGDGFMALFGIGKNSDQHAQRAVEAGKAMLRWVAESRPLFEQAGWPDLEIGIGINTGTAVVGSIGSPKRQEYTAIGDTVNVAARVESLTKELGCHLIVTQCTAEQLSPETTMRDLPPQRVKGKADPLNVFAIEY